MEKKKKKEKHTGFKFQFDIEQYIFFPWASIFMQSLFTSFPGLKFSIKLIFFQ